MYTSIQAGAVSEVGTAESNPAVVEWFAVRLTKWYMDLVMDDGRVAIVSWARLEGFGPVLTWSNRLTRRGLAVEDVKSTSPVGGPHHDGDVMQWSHAGLSFVGQWQRSSEPITRRLHESQHGAILWECLMPRAIATMTIDGEILHGHGYTERLTMTLRPWLLPIRNLRWGRFHSSTGGGVVWLEWNGSCPLSVVVCDGIEASGAAIKDDVIESGDWRLDLACECVLRDGAIGSTALSGVPGLGRIAPIAMLGTHEHKRLSRGIVSRHDGRIERGWAIHEVVRFEGTRG